jgi:hypothetical protein
MKRSGGAPSESFHTPVNQTTGPPRRAQSLHLCRATRARLSFRARNHPVHTSLAAKKKARIRRGPASSQLHTASCQQQQQQQQQHTTPRRAVPSRSQSACGPHRSLLSCAVQPCHAHAHVFPLGGSLSLPWSGLGMHARDDDEDSSSTKRACDGISFCVSRPTKLLPL